MVTGCGLSDYQRMGRDVTMKRQCLPDRGRRMLILAGLASLSLTLAGCGKRGPLEPPPDSPDAKKPTDQSSNATVPGGIRGGTRRPAPIRRPTDSFILDPLLD